jgi:hypothetical protein
MNVLSNAIDALNECNYGRSYDDIEAAPNTALFRLVRYTTEVGTRHCRVPTAIEEQSGCTS